MTGPDDSHEKSPQTVRAELCHRLRERSTEIEKAIFARVRHLAEAGGDQDPAYVDGLQSAVSEAVGYGIECVEKGSEWPVPIPPGTARQARRAARDGVGLDTVLRRYMAGNKLLEEFIVAESANVPHQVLRQILRDQGPQVDRLIESVATEYRDELERTGYSSVERFAHRVLHLLSGDDFEAAADINYDFDIWHVGMILIGQNAKTAVRMFVGLLGCRSLHIERDRETVWAWLGSSQRSVIENLERSFIGSMPVEVSLAIGEPRRGLDGWRLTHCEAQAALQVMLRRPRRLTSCRDVILLAGVLRDETLVRSLLDTYLVPLEGNGDTGRGLRETLRAYFSAGGNAAAAAASLGVTRHTVQRRIRMIERTIGQHLHTCHAELQVALQLDELNRSSSSGFDVGT